MSLCIILHQLLATLLPYTTLFRSGLLDPRRADRLLLGGLPRRLVLRLLRLLLAATLMLLPRVVLVLSGLELLRLGLGGTGPGGGERLLGGAPRTGTGRGRGPVATALRGGPGFMVHGSGARARGLRLAAGGLRLGAGRGAGRGRRAAGARGGAARLEARGDDGHADLVAQGVVDHGAEDDVGIGVRGFLNQARGLRDLVEPQVAAALDGQQHAIGAVDRGLQQR